MQRFSTVLALAMLTGTCSSAFGDPLPNTKPLTIEDDLAMYMVEGIDRYLDRQLATTAGKNQHPGKLALDTPEDYLESVKAYRHRLEYALGTTDRRLPIRGLEYISSTIQQRVVGQTDAYYVYAVRWPVLPGVEGEGLLLEPKANVRAFVVAIPDADWTPEMLIGSAPGISDNAQFARRLAENGCRVVVPTLINRDDTFSGNPVLGRMTNQPHREFIYRMAFEMGRHILGYEVQKVLSLVDWASKTRVKLPIGVMGYGEGGVIALHAAALDTRIQATVVSGYFGPTAGTWQEPIYRNVWSLLRDFSPARMVQMILPRLLILECSEGPRVDGPPPVRAGRRGAAPGKLVPMDGNTLQKHILVSLQEALPTYRKTERLFNQSEKCLLVNDDGKLPGNDTTLHNFLAGLLGEDDVKVLPGEQPSGDTRKNFDPKIRQKRQFDQLVDYTQKLMRDSERIRRERFWSKLDYSSPKKFEQSTAPFDKLLWEEVIGKLPPATMPLNVRTRQIFDEPKWWGFEVVLDVYPNVIATGTLLIPKNLADGERRPVVVCQHGLEGRPIDVVNPRERTRAYNSFGAELADLGYIVYAPQNPYIGKDKFRVLQRKANPLGLSLFSFILRQHERTLDWLKTLPFVDGKRLAFYGLSYGGKTAMRVPALLPDYCLSICAGDFNEWTWKNVSLDFRGSYMFTGEYEMCEYNMGHTIVYAEMAALISPRPFMVERGHRDGVGIDEWVAYEYAKVRRHYVQLGLADRTEIEFFPGVHEINGEGTYRFLKKHLAWPK